MITPIRRTVFLQVINQVSVWKCFNKLLFIRSLYSIICIHLTKGMGNGDFHLCLSYHISLNMPCFLYFLQRTWHVVPHSKEWSRTGNWWSAKARASWEPMGLSPTDSLSLRNITYNVIRMFIMFVWIGDFVLKQRFAYSLRWTLIYTNWKHIM